MQGHFNRVDTVRHRSLHFGTRFHMLRHHLQQRMISTILFHFSSDLRPDHVLQLRLHCLRPSLQLQLRKSSLQMRLVESNILYQCWYHLLNRFSQNNATWVRFAQFIRLGVGHSRWNIYHVLLLGAQSQPCWLEIIRCCYYLAAVFGHAVVIRQWLEVVVAAACALLLVVAASAAHSFGYGGFTGWFVH